MTSRSAVVRGEIFSEEGRLLCAAQGTLTIVAPKAS
jgi:acyl-coenzyme A thioesterase PaaI-like protein